MPGPFPGMDPYLESPVRWPDLHFGLINELRVALNRILPRNYVAKAGERVYVMEPSESIYPDVSVFRQKAPIAGSPRGASAVLDESDTAWLVQDDPVEVREPYLEILAVEDEKQVVTAIEVLSPSNKERGSTGRSQYRSKQHELLESGTHLLEIDLLHGEHTVAVSEGQLRKRGTWDYLICLHRANAGRAFEVWAVSLRQRLPRIHVPLSLGDADIILDFQEIFDRSYEGGGYDRHVDYRKDPPVKLRQEEVAWLDSHLREQGLRD